MRYDDALILLKEGLLSEFGELWHHYPMVKQDVNSIATIDVSRSEKDFIGMFFAPCKIDEMNLSVGYSSNVPTIETKSDIDIKQNDLIENEKGDKYQVSNIKNTTRKTIILDLKVVKKA